MFNSVGVPNAQTKVGEIVKSPTGFDWSASILRVLCRPEKVMDEQNLAFATDTPRNKIAMILHVLALATLR